MRTKIFKPYGNFTHDDCLQICSDINFDATERPTDQIIVLIFIITLLKILFQSRFFLFQITRQDQLPKRICDACSNKLDLLYEFWNSSASAEKTLLSWLGQAGVEDAGEKISAVAQQIAKPAETLVKEESEPLDESNLINESRDSFDEQSLDDEVKFILS